MDTKNLVITDLANTDIDISDIDISSTDSADGINGSSIDMTGIDITDITNTDIGITDNDIMNAEIVEVKVEKKVEQETYTKQTDTNCVPDWFYPRVRMAGNYKHYNTYPVIFKVYELNIDNEDGKSFIIFDGRYSCLSKLEYDEEMNKYSNFENYKHTINNDRLLPKLYVLIYWKTTGAKPLYYIVNVYDKDIKKDISQSWYDEEEGYNICLFPKYIIKLSFNVIEQMQNMDSAKKKLAELIALKI